MSQEKNNSQYKEYYIAFIDMLGFKRLVNNEDNLEYILNIFDKVNHHYRIDTFVGDAEKPFKEDKTYFISTKIISDSMSIYRSR